MKNQLTLLLALLPVILAAQSSKNVTLRSFVPIDEEMNDIWGYVAPDGTEYAIAGSENGTYFFDLSDPDNPVQTAFVDGPNSTWRDMKVWGDYAYATNENSGGLQIMDLSQLPNSVSLKTWNGSGNATFESAHNVFIDEKGYAYIVGADNEDARGAIIADLSQDPWNPELTTVYNGGYIHDIFVRGDTLWGAEIYNGYVSVVDISDKTPDVIPDHKIMATQPTPNSFTHNVWVSDDNSTMVTTDEVSGAKVATYDVSDLSNIQSLDQYQSNPGTNVIPHNAFYLDNFIVISYYRDGLRIVDASQPDNLVETGHYDTSPMSGGGFNGAWGVYPYLPSGLMLISDIEQGLFVLDPTLVKASNLEGMVTDTNTSQALMDVAITMEGPATNEAATDAFGLYKTGVADSGKYDITFFKPGYKTKVLKDVSLLSGQTTQLNVELVPLPTYQVSGTVFDAYTLDPIPFAPVKATDGYNTFSTTTDINGNFQLDTIYQDSFNFYAGEWGYRTNDDDPVYVSGSSITPDIYLELGYYDDFCFDLGWSVSGDAVSGIWERDIPIGTIFQGATFNPDSDVEDDLGEYCYVTGNGGGDAGVDDVDDGTTILRSPWIDVSEYNEPVLEYHKWFMNGGGSSFPDDTLRTIITDNQTSVTLDVTGLSSGGQFWQKVSTEIDEHWDISKPFRIHFVVSDFASSGHLVEAGIDKFEVFEGSGVPPTAGFYIEGTSGCAPFTFQPIDTSSGQVTDLTWVVSGPVVDTFYGSDPVITLDTAGTYDVKLIAANVFGTDEFEQKEVILVIDAPDVSATATATQQGLEEGTATAIVKGGTPPYAYEWNDPHNQTGQTATGLPAGVYSVTVTDANGCIDSATVVVEISTGMQNQPLDKVTVSPNPFTDQLVIRDVSTTRLRWISIYNVLGETVPFDRNGSILKLSPALSAGIYFIQIVDHNGNRRAIKLMKE